MKIEGKNSVYEALRSEDVTVNALMCEKGTTSNIVALAKKLGVKITFVDKAVLDKESVEGRHQGYIADVTDFKYCELEDILTAEHPFVVVWTTSAIRTTSAVSSVRASAQAWTAL